MSTPQTAEDFNRALGMGNIKFFVDRFTFKMYTRGRMATTPQVDISKQMLEQVVTQLSFALAAAKDAPPDVVSSGTKFLAELKKWAESK